MACRSMLFTLLLSSALSGKMGLRIQRHKGPVDEAEAKLSVKEIEQEQEENWWNKLFPGSDPSKKPKPKIEAWYINMQGHTDRQQCMDIQLRDLGFEPHREEGVLWPANPWENSQASITLNRIKSAGLGDCIKNGIDVKRVEDHQAVTISQDFLRANILSNYCGHKRLIEKLAHSNTTADYFLIFEDDAQLKPWFRVILEDFVQNYEGPWSAVQIDPFFIKSSTRRVKEGLAKEFRNKKIYHGGILSGIQTMLIKKERISEVILALNTNSAIPADHIGRFIDSMIAWKPYISTHPGWYGEKINEKCPKSVRYSRIGGSKQQPEAKFLAEQGFADGILGDDMDEAPDDNGPVSVLNNLGEEQTEKMSIMNDLPGKRHAEAGKV